MLLRPGLFTSLLILLAMLIFVVRLIVPFGNIVVLMIPALFVALVFNPLAWGLAYLLYTAISGVISSAISAVAGAVLGPEAAIPAIAVSISVALLAAVFAFLSRIIPIIAGALYVAIIAPLLIYGFGIYLGIFDVLFCLLIVYYFIFGGKKIPYLVILLVGVAMVYGYLSVGISIINIVIGLALILLTAAAIGLPVRGKIKDTVVKVLYLYLLAHIGVRTIVSLWQYPIATTMIKFMEALAGLGLLAVLTPAGMILLIFLIGLFSGDPKIPDNLMKILAFVIILTYISAPAVGVSGFMWVSSLQWSGINYINDLIGLVYKINPDAASIFAEAVGPFESIPAEFEKSGSPFAIFFQGEQVGGEIKQPRPTPEAPSPEERLGVSPTNRTYLEPPSLVKVFIFIVDNIIKPWRNFSILGASLLIIFIAYVLDLMAGTIGYDIFGARPVAEAITRKPPEEKYKAYAEEAMEKAGKAKKAAEKTKERVVTAITWTSAQELAKEIVKWQREAKRMEKMTKKLMSPEVQKALEKKKALIIERMKSIALRRKAEAMRRRFELGDRIINELKNVSSVLVTKVVRPVSGGRKITYFRITPRKKKGEKK